MSKNNRFYFVGGFAAVPREVLNSPAYVALSYPARALLMEAYLRAGKSQNGNISLPLSQLKHRGWNSSATLAKSIKELEALGFIKVTRNTAGVQNGSKLCKLYRITDRDSYGFIPQHVEGVKASKDYLQFTSLTQAKQTLKKLASVKKDDSSNERSPFRK